jgi:type I restriction enzyme R subunit
MPAEGHRNEVEWNEKELAEDPAIKALVKLGYTAATGKEMSPDADDPERERFSDVYLEGRLRDAIKRFNPWINDRNLNQAVSAITKARAIDTVHTNSELHEKLVRHISVEQDLGYGRKNQTVKFIDYEDPENNDFLVVSQMKFAGLEENIIPDLVIYLNGIPVAVIECKSPTVRDPKERAVKQLMRYQNLRNPTRHEGHEELFYPNQIIVAAWGVSAAAATIGARYQHYKEWKDPYPATEPELEELFEQHPTKQDILLYSMFKKDRLLDLIQSFTVFEEKGQGMVKMMARYQQYRAVEKALERINDPPKPGQRGGVVWHTQGSGKSLTMLFLATKLRRLRDNPLILIVTDRVDLDVQITKTFRRCGFPNPIHADSIRHLREELATEVGMTLLTTIHKFQEPDEKVETVLTDSPDVYVMADEAHRTQYSVLANFMRIALPNACYLGFTGTPIEKKHKNTRDTFGRYIDTYTIEQSVEDGMTVPIMYEGRMPDLWVEGKNLDEIFDRVFADKSEEERYLIKRRYANEMSVAESEERITQVCLDLIDHYNQRIRPNGLKAQIVTVSRRAAARYKETLDELNAPPSAVIYSGVPNDPDIIKQFHTSQAEQNLLIERFKSDMRDDRLSILIVCDMLITGFDAPVEQVMYLDKPLKEHNLLQAIARVNRPYKGKNYGLIVDYYGISADLGKALEMYSKRDVENALRPLEEELPRLEARHRAVMAFFDDVDMTDIEACALILEPEDVRKRFEIAFRKFAESMDMLMPHPKARPYLEDLKRLGKIKQYARNMYRDEDIDISGAGEKVRELIDKYIRAEGIEYLQKEPVSILDDDFEETIDTHTSDKAKASEMEHAIRYEITIHYDENPVVYQSLRERLEEIIRRMEQERLELSQVIEEYGHIIQRMRDVREGREAQKKGFTDTEYAAYELIHKEAESAFKEKPLPEKELRKMTKEIVKELKDLAVIDFRRERDVRRQMRGQIKRILVKNGWSHEHFEPITTRIMELAEVRL